MRNTKLYVWTVLAVLSVTAPSVLADTTYTVTGSTTGGSVSGMAAFSVTANGTIQVVLTNTETLSSTTKWDDGQLISGIDFTLTTALTSTPTLTSGTGGLLTITNGQGGTPVSSSLVPDWGLIAGTSKTNVNLSTLNGGKPQAQIIGAANGPGGTWDVNASVTQHNPNVVVDATFDISAPGVTTSTDLAALLGSSVTFEFGTDPTNVTSTGCTQSGVTCGSVNVSEASSADFLAADFGMLALFVGFLYFRRRRISSARA